jgi:hypothetical protein
VAREPQPGQETSSKEGMMSTATVPRAPEPPAPTPPPARRRDSKALLIGAAVSLFVVAALVSFLLTRGDSGEGKARAGAGVSGSARTSYTISKDANWQWLTGKALAEQPGEPLSVMRRKDGTGLLVVRGEGRAPESLRNFTKQLDREFERRIPDFQKRSARTLRIEAGEAFVYSYIRERRGTVHSVVLVPAGARSYVLDSVVQGGEADTAKELGRMIVSFDA